jgi:hypothetical protein
MTMKRQVTVVIDVQPDGTATVQIPHDRNVAGNAEAAASFTDKLSQAMGEVTERHIGDHHHSEHEHNHVHI